MDIATCENFFASSARSAGSRLYKEGKVTFSKPFSLEVTAYVKSNYRVSLKTESPQLSANCNCPPSQKGQLCKHIWAAFLAVFEKVPDFFKDVREVVKKETVAKAVRPETEAQINSKAAFKAKQDDYRKQQYQKQKERAKEFKNKKKKSFDDTPAFPIAVQEALNFFSKNGFSLSDSLDEASVFFARKKLSRIFHPDVGGSHDESLELNNNSEILLKYIGK